MTGTDRIPGKVFFEAKILLPIGLAHLQSPPNLLKIVGTLHTVAG
jgi:hypothetical protein